MTESWSMVGWGWFKTELTEGREPTRMVLLLTEFKMSWTDMAARLASASILSLISCQFCKRRSTPIKKKITLIPKERKQKEEVKCLDLNIFLHLSVCGRVNLGVKLVIW